MITSGAIVADDHVTDQVVIDGCPFRDQAREICEAKRLVHQEHRWLLD